MVWRLGDLWQTSIAAFALVLMACIYFVIIGIRLSIIDVREHLLPNRIVLPSYAVVAALLGTAAVLGGGWDDLVRMLLAAAALWGFYFLLRLLYPAGMGYGDVKLAGVLGLYLGYASWAHTLIGTVTAFILAGLSGLWLILSRRGTAQSRIPFGPYMLFGAAAALAALPPLHA